MEFLIGNGNIFEEKDVMLAIQNLDFDSKIKIVESITKDLIKLIDAGKSELADDKAKRVAITAEGTLRTIVYSMKVMTEKR